LRPELQPQEATQLTVASSTAVCRAIRSETGLRPEIKWPNDILIHGRKVVGVLTEMNAEVDKVRYVIVGVGINVNLAVTELPADVRKLATSLRIEFGRPVSRPQLAAVILRELDRDYSRVRAGQFEAVADEWEEKCVTIGRHVVIQIGDRKVRGRAESLGEDGALLVRTEHGRLERISGGDVTLEK
jgi:BirA family biotin operon repressor/biotin-[acetyl-CoA-carboxylase] ligase